MSNMAVKRIGEINSIIMLIYTKYENNDVYLLDGKDEKDCKRKFGEWYKNKYKHSELETMSFEEIFELVIKRSWMTYRVF